MILIARSPFSFAANRVVRPLQLLLWWFACLLLLGMVQTPAFAVTPMVVAGGSHSCALSSAGAVTCWGLNSNGQLGNNSTTDSSIPVLVTGLSSGVTAIAAGDGHTCAIVNGAAQCWGTNAYGQLGNNSIIDSPVPVAVTGLGSGVTAITGGAGHSCAIINGGAQCWGYNTFGKLGNGSTTDSPVPVAVAGLGSGIAAITSGYAHTCAIATNGAAKCWGFNGDGQLGNGSITDSLVPMAVTGLSSGITAIAAGSYHTCAINSSGGAQCWGYNFYGQLGNNSLRTSLVPVAVNGLSSGVIGIASGSNHICIINSSGGAQCWGNNAYGQLGNNSTIKSKVPVAVNGLSSGVTGITGGGGQACAIFNSAAQCWGFNGNGELGNNSTTDSLFPVAVMSTKSPQTISFGTAPSLTYGGAAGTISATATSSLAVTYTSTTTSICTVSGNAVTPLAIGTCTIAANQAGDANYNAAPQVTQNITVAQATQATLTPAATNVNPAYLSTTTLSTTGGSGSGAVTYASNNANCTIVGNTLTAAAVGSCTVTAAKAADTNYSVATGTLNITVGKTAQAAFSVTATNTTLTTGGTATLSSTGGTGAGAVTYTSNSASCTMAGSTLTAVSAGSCTITATKSGGNNYFDATATVNITVAAPPTPVTPNVPSYGTVGQNSGGAGAELIIAGGTLITAGTNGGTVQATGAAGVSTVSVTGGSVVIPCPVATAFCKTGQSTVTVLAGETVRFSVDGKVISIQFNPAAPNSSSDRLGGKNLIDLIVATIQTKVPAIGTETVRKADAWNTLGLGFTMGKLSVAAQLPMQVNPTLEDSVSILPNGTLQVVTNGVIVNLIPALLDTDRFNATLKSFNPNAEMRINSDGTINVSSNRLIYSLRPHLFSVNGDQSIFPATYKFDQFAAMLLNLDSSTTVQMQLDGKLALTIQGTTYILTPDYEVFLGTAPSGVAIHNGKLIVTYLFGFTQGFTVER